MIARAHHRFTFQDYLQLEEDSGTKHEFLDGQVFAMSGGTPEHAGITGNVMALLHRALAGKTCRVFSPDLRVRSRVTGLGTYADATVVYGALELDPEDPKRHTVLNPKVVIEVLNPSTEDYDRGEKLGHYKTIDSLEEVVLVAHDRQEIEIVRRETDGSWSRHIAREDDDVTLRAVSCTLPVREIYRDPLTGSS